MTPSVRDVAKTVRRHTRVSIHIDRRTVGVDNTMGDLIKYSASQKILPPPPEVF